MNTEPAFDANVGPGRRRYPGLQPFRKEDTALFFGRQAETREFYNLVLVEKLVLLFAKSGMGKSSLLNAGLVPLLEKTSWHPLFFRLNRPDCPLKTQFLEQLQCFQDDALLDSNLTLWEIFKRIEWKKGNLPARPLLIFDQFEELFTLFEESERLEFVEELADLANGRMPDKVQADLRAKIAGDELLPDEIEQSEQQPRVKFIFSIRSDLLHLFDSLSPEIPDILRSRYELKPLSLTGAKEAITLPAALEGAFACSPFEFSEQAVNEILQSLGPTVEKSSFESSQLQIICQSIENRVIQTAENRLLVEPALYGSTVGLSRILAHFYSNQIGTLHEKDQLIARKLIEEGLITSNERRRSVDEDDLLKQFGATRLLLDQLVEMRLLRKEPRLNSYYFEISHDTLVAPILQAWKQRTQAENDQLEQKKLAEKERQLAEQRQIAERERLLREQAETNSRKARIFSAVAFALFLLACGAAFFAFQQSKRAWLALGDAALNDGRFEEAIGYFRQSAQYSLPRKPIEMRIDQAITIKKEMMMADSLANLSVISWPLAREAYDRAASAGFARANLKSAAISEKMEAEYKRLFESGDDFFHAKGYQDALTAWETAIGIHPESIELIEKINRCKLILSH